MKKLLLQSFTALMLASGLLMSCTKSHSVNPVDDKGGLINSSSSSGSSGADDRRSGTSTDDSSKTKTNDDSTKTGTSTNVTLPGTWKVTYYYDKTKDETSDYSGYSFIFNNNGTATATKGTTIVSGTWKIITDSGVKKMVIMLGTTTKPLVELNDDWVVISMSATEIKLRDKDVNKNEILTFGIQ